MLKVEDLRMGLPLQPQTIATGFRYKANSDHRNGTAGKSQWSLSEEEERSVFNAARVRNWLLPSPGWGLHSPNDLVAYLGSSCDGRSLFVAKFVASHAPMVWYGYPADHQRNRRDVPPLKLLQDWEASGLISPSQKRKILRGQPCSL